MKKDRLKLRAQLLQISHAIYKGQIDFVFCDSCDGTGEWEHLIPICQTCFGAGEKLSVNTET